MKQIKFLLIALIMATSSFGQLPTNGLDKPTFLEHLKDIQLTAMIGYKFNDQFPNQAFGRAAVSYPVIGHNDENLFEIGIMFDLTEGLFDHDRRPEKQEGGSFQKGLYNVGVSDFIKIELYSGFDFFTFDLLFEDFFLNPEFMKTGGGLSFHIDEQISIGMALFRMPYQESFQARTTVSIIF